LIECELVNRSALPRSIAHTFGETLGVGQCFDRAQDLWIAVEQHARANVGAKGRGDDLISQSQFDEVELGVDLSDRQTCVGIGLRKVTKGFENTIRNRIIAGLRIAPILDLLNTI